MSGLKLATLVARLHLDGFRVSPASYCKALWWRVAGKRLRAKARFSPLIGRSAVAYRVWLARRRATPAEGDAVGAPKGPSILVIIDARDNQAEVPTTLASLADPDRAIILDVNGSVPDSTGSLGAVARQLGRGEVWLLPLRAGDRLEPGAERHYSLAATDSDARFIYADDDERDARGEFTKPHFKPLWNAELFRYHDYLSWSGIVKVDRHSLAAVDGKYDWVERLTAQAAVSAPPRHVPLVLHHRVTRPQPIPPPSLPLHRAGDLPAVSIIIPTRNGTDLLRTCLEGLERTTYPALEVIIADNDSDDATTLALLSTLDASRHTVIRHGGPFNYSAINNAAVRHATAPFLCFLNNDIEILEPDWLSVLVTQAIREDVGAVGPMLLYPDGTVQHAGVVLGVGGGAAHAHRNIHPGEEGYFRRHTLPQFVSAVTGACLVVARRHFDAVGGFDESNFPVAFNDVDLCLKLARIGYPAFYEPRARLVHHESKSRGNDRDAAGARRLEQELRALKMLWGTDRQRDPYHHRSLSPYSEQFVIGL